MEKIRVGIIGCGGRCQSHIHSLLQMDDVEIVAIAEPIEERRLAGSQKTGAKRLYKDHNELFAHENHDTLDVLYILERGDSVHSLADLEGKTILSSGQGTTAQAVTDYLLNAAGVNATVEYAAEHSEVVARATAENAAYDVVLLPEPFVTMLTKQAPEFHVTLNLTEEWENQGAGLLPMGGIAVRREFAEANPEAVAAFLAEYAASVEWVNANAEEAAALIEKYDIMKAAVAKDAIPRANMVCLTGDAMRMVLENFYGVLEGFNVKLIGGAAPGEEFYYGASGEGASVAVIGGADGPTAIYVAPTESGK